MNERALFNNTEQAVTVTFNMVNRLAILVGRLIFWSAHLAIAVALLYLLWAFGLTAEQAAMFLRDALQERPLSIASAIGFSALGALTGYWRLARWANNKIVGGWLIEYLIQDSKV